MSNWLDRLVCQSDLLSATGALDAALAKNGWHVEDAPHDNHARRLRLTVGSIGNAAVFEFDSEDPDADAIASALGAVSEQLRTRCALVREPQAYEESLCGATSALWEEGGTSAALIRRELVSRPTDQEWLETKLEEYEQAGPQSASRFLEYLVAGRFGIKEESRSVIYGQPGQIDVKIHRWCNVPRVYVHASAPLGVGPRQAEFAAFFDDLFARIFREREVAVRGFGSFRCVPCKDGITEVRFKTGRELAHSLDAEARAASDQSGFHDASPFDEARWALSRTDDDVQLGRRMVLFKKMRGGGFGMNPMSMEPIPLRSKLIAGVSAAHLRG